MSIDHSDVRLETARLLAADGRYAESIAAYQRALRGTQDPAARIEGGLELALVALQADDLETADRAWLRLRRDLAQSARALEPVMAFLLPHMFRVAHGDTEGVVEAMQEYFDDCVGSLPLNDVITILEFTSMVLDLDNSRVHASTVLLEIAELYERTERTHGGDALAEAVADAYWQHAHYLISLEAALAHEIRDGEAHAPEWARIVDRAVDGFSSGDDPIAALRCRALRSLAASDRTGAASRHIRLQVGLARIGLLADLNDRALVAKEARRLIPIADQAGAWETAGQLRALRAAAHRPDPGPGLGA